MKKLDVGFEGIHDGSGYLFSFAKCLAAAVKHSPYVELSEDIVASSGFAFRMWVAADLCPSGTSIWSFDDQKRWVENGGLHCDYVGRYWGQEEVEEERRLKAIEMIKKSIENHIPAVAWDIGVPEWGLILGYDDNTRMLATLSITGEENTMAYEMLGKREVPILSVLTITGKADKSKGEIMADTKKLAAFHLEGNEWCENVKGLAVYPKLISHVQEKFNPDESWNLEYYLGTYGELKYYAWRYFQKYEQTELAELYGKVYEAWRSAYHLKKSKDVTQRAVQEEIAALLTAAYEAEKQACGGMKNGTK